MFFGNPGKGLIIKFPFELIVEVLQLSFFFCKHMRYFNYSGESVVWVPVVWIWFGIPFMKGIGILRGIPWIPKHQFSTIVECCNWRYSIHQPVALVTGDMDVSENSGTPTSSILIGFSIRNHPFWGIPIFGNTHMESLSRMFCRIILLEPNSWHLKGWHQGIITGWWKLTYFWNFHPDNWGRWTYFDDLIFFKAVETTN